MSTRVAARPTHLYLNGADEQADGDFNVDVPAAYEPKSIRDSPLRKRGTSRTQPRPEFESGIATPPTPPAIADSRTSRFIEEMVSDINNRSSTEALRSSYNRPSTEALASSSSSAIPQALVNPATVPIRTSSARNAFGNGDGNNSSPDKKKSPRRHKSMASVPEERKQHHSEFDDRRKRFSSVVEEEHSWLGRAKQKSRESRVASDPPPPARFSHEQQPSVSSSGAADPTSRGVGADLISGISLGWSAEKENILKGPFDYLESHPGKDVRTQLITAFNAWLQVPPASLRIITDVVTMLHSASLLIDDVEDSSQLRRGVPVAHSIFGTAQTINSANYVYFRALQELLKLQNSEAIQIYTEELLNLHRGQGMDLFWRDTLTCPSEDDYLEMVGNKTGGLFRLAIKLMCAESPSHNNRPKSSGSSSTDFEQQPDYIPLVNTISLLFQILDDYRNLNTGDTTYTTNKGLCEDLTEGKFSFPIIHAIRSAPSNLVLVNILKQKTRDEEVKRFAVKYMEGVGSFAYTRRVLRGLGRKAGVLVEEVDGGRGCGDGVRRVVEGLRVAGEGRKGAG
ncbi:geranylgeranyl pyrophosphate synthetase [Vermiconidia calcicola]|uniref:Geranylgeranyl pyrophosphate synthetase n=1 Tax=Vermiconidia calcicola TaxID=1690605 RepID=A0ACC3MXE5_9PEZI|nr:geranylgeranyl pyrophosphate synthetase [Vermiconidia calcicola]